MTAVMLTCQHCGGPFEAKVARAKWCSAKCRKAVQRGAEVVALPAPSDAPDPLDIGPVFAATLAKLTAAERVADPSAQVALALAARLDRPNMDTGSAMASVARQHSAAMSEALKGAGAQSAPGQLQDELAARRAAHA